MADDFRVRFGFFDHPKTVKLQRLRGLGPSSEVQPNLFGGAA